MKSNLQPTNLSNLTFKLLKGVDRDVRYYYALLLSCRSWLTHLGTGFVCQHGETVIRFLGMVTWRRRMPWKGSCHASWISLFWFLFITGKKIIWILFVYRIRILEIRTELYEIVNILFMQYLLLSLHVLKKVFFEWKCLLICFIEVLNTT